MSEILVLNPDVFKAKIKQIIQEVFREKLSMLQDTQIDDSYLTRKEVADWLRRSTIITSQLLVKEWYDVIGEKRSSVYSPDLEQ